MTTIDQAAAPVFATTAMGEPAARQVLPDAMMAPEVAYRIVKDETLSETRPQLNLATFVTTYMDEHATALMNEAINLNFIDETEYPRVAVMSQRCINILANLWHTPETAQSKAGALGIGSSEACMLGGVAAWLRWRARREAAGLPTDKPNLVISSGYQIVWEKFAELWQIELRTVPLSWEHQTLDPEAAVARCDENTICVVPIAGVTYTGLNDDVAALDAALDSYNARTGHDVCIHVDAATGGFILPFLQPDTAWDFRLPWVLSISTSGHKFGLVYPGVGWVVWRDRSCLPGKMAFSADYLGSEVVQIGLNYSRPAAQVLGQYYQFLRLGRAGYTAVQSQCLEIAKYARSRLGSLGPLRMFGDDVVNPLFCWTLTPEAERSAKWTLYDLQYRLQESGWMVPAYTLPADLETTVVMRMVVRQGLSRDLVDQLIGNVEVALAELDALEHPTASRLAATRHQPAPRTTGNHSGRHPRPRG